MKGEGNFLTRLLDSRGRPKSSPERQAGKHRWVGETEMGADELLLYGAARRCARCEKVTVVYHLKGERCPDCQKLSESCAKAPAQSGKNCTCVQTCNCRYPLPDNWDGGRQLEH